MRNGWRVRLHFWLVHNSFDPSIGSTLVCVGLDLDPRVPARDGCTCFFVPSVPLRVCVCVFPISSEEHLFGFLHCFLLDPKVRVHHSWTNVPKHFESHVHRSYPCSYTSHFFVFFLLFHDAFCLVSSDTLGQERLAPWIPPSSSPPTRHTHARPQIHPGLHSMPLDGWNRRRRSHTMVGCADTCALVPLRR